MSTSKQDQDYVKVQPDGTLGIRAADLPLATALRLLSLQSGRNIISSPAVKGTVTAELHDVTFEEALGAILRMNNCDYRIEGNLINVYTLDELAPITHRYYQLSYVTATDVAAVIKPLLSENGNVISSPPTERGISIRHRGATGDALAGNSFVVVYDYPERLDAVGALIKRIDVKPSQVLVEATILRARLNEDNALGIDFTTVGGIDFTTLGSVSPAAQSIATGNTPPGLLGDTTFTARTEFNASIPAGGFTFGIIKDQVAVFIRALEQITDAQVLANPKLLVLNKQVGNVIVGRRDGYITTTVTETAAVQKIDFLETGTQLTFRPFISADGYVRLELHPEDSIGGLTPDGLPFEQTTEVTTNVIVRDGHTILIGGLFREVDTNSRSQIPLLGDVPGVGNLFRSRNDSMEREEVIILLTVHVIKNDAAYAKYSTDQLEDFERHRVGLRRGVMWHGRERLAQSYYRRAIERYAGGQTGPALWYIRMALHNRPRFLPAIKLKEEIEGAREWDEDGTVTRNFVRDLIRHEQGQEVPAPPFGRPALPLKRDEDRIDPGSEGRQAPH